MDALFNKAIQRIRLPPITEISEELWQASPGIRTGDRKSACPSSAREDRPPHIPLCTALTWTVAEARGRRPKSGSDDVVNDAFLATISIDSGVEVNLPQACFFPGFWKLIRTQLIAGLRFRSLFKPLLRHGVAALHGSDFGGRFSEHRRFSVALALLPKALSAGLLLSHAEGSA